MSLDDAYLLQNITAGYCGNSPMFWRAGGSGYTPWIAEASLDEGECRKADAVYKGLARVEDVAAGTDSFGIKGNR